MGTVASEKSQWFMRSFAERDCDPKAKVICACCADSPLLHPACGELHVIGGRHGGRGAFVAVYELSSVVFPPFRPHHPFAQLEDRISAELFGSYTYTAAAVVLAVVAARFVPSQHRFLPLLVVGTPGAYLDYRAGQARAEPYRLQLQQLRRDKRAAPPVSSVHALPQQSSPQSSDGQLR